MKLDMAEAPDSVLNERGVEVGNVYRNQQGRLYLIISTDRRCTALVITREGLITGAQDSYGATYFARHPLVGRASLPETLAVDWYVAEKYL